MAIASAALPSFHGPRAFSIPADQDISASALHAQTQAKATAAAIVAARTRAANVGRTGGLIADARAERVRQAKLKMRNTSSSVAASARLQETQAASLARAIQAASSSSAATVEPTYFSGSHLVVDDTAAAAHASASHDSYSTRSFCGVRSSPTAAAGSSGSQSARGSTATQTRRPSDADSRGGWNTSRPRENGVASSAAARSSLDAFTTHAASAPMAVAPLDPLSDAALLSPRRRAQTKWDRQLQRRRRAMDGGGGGAVSTTSDDAAEQARSMHAVQKQQWHQQQARDLADHDDAALLDGSGDALSPDSLAASQSASAFDPRLSFQHSLQSYTQQWWVRLHNSENKVNTSPYYIGNKSVYYDLQQPIQSQHAEESKDASSHLPPIAAAASEPPALKKLVNSASLDASAAAVPAAASPSSVSTLRHLLSSAPAGSSSLSSPRPPPAVAGVVPGEYHGYTAAMGSSAASPLSPRLLGSAHAGPRFSTSTSRRTALAAHTTLASLSPAELANLNPSWQAQPQRVAWKRRPESMTLRDAPPPPPLVGAPLPARVVASQAPSRFDRDLAAIRALQAHNRRTAPKFSYDSVSELHGFLSQKNIRALLKQTNYNRRELYVIYVRFKALCALSPTPHGIDAQTFKRGVARLAVEDDKFVGRVFSLVDSDGSGQIEWEEFLSAMSALEKGDLEAKCRFFFQIYDADADGLLSRRDLATMFHASSMLEADETTTEVVQTFVNKVFSQFGFSPENAAAKISFELVLAYMKKQKAQGGTEDVWAVFGRSMLHDFTSRPEK